MAGIQAAGQPGALSRDDVYRAFASEIDATDKTRQTYARNLRQWRAFLDGAGIAETEATRRRRGAEHAAGARPRSGLA